MWTRERERSGLSPPMAAGEKRAAGPAPHGRSKKPTYVTKGLLMNYPTTPGAQGAGRAGACPPAPGGGDQQSLVRAVVAASVSDDFATAASELDLVGVAVRRGSHCACGHCITYEHYLTNRRTGLPVGPVGSCCVRRLGRRTLNGASRAAHALLRVRDQSLADPASELPIRRDEGGRLTRAAIRRLGARGAFDPVDGDGLGGMGATEAAVAVLKYFNARRPSSALCSLAHEIVENRARRVIDRL